MDSSTVSVCEIFGNTIQGEGPQAGQPATFVRLAGCVAPYCDFCDSKYSWEKGKEMTLKEVVEEVDKYPAELVVLTGGEPFAQEGTPRLICALMTQDFKVSVETSGKVPLTVPFGTLVICSPKRYAGEFLVCDSALGAASFYKFVVGNESDYDHAKAFIKKNLKFTIKGFYTITIFVNLDKKKY